MAFWSFGLINSARLHHWNTGRKVKIWKCVEYEALVWRVESIHCCVTAQVNCVCMPHCTYSSADSTWMTKHGSGERLVCRMITNSSSTSSFCSHCNLHAHTVGYPRFPAICTPVKAHALSARTYCTTHVTKSEMAHLTEMKWDWMRGEYGSTSPWDCLRVVEKVAGRKAQAMVCGNGASSSFCGNRTHWSHQMTFQRSSELLMKIEPDPHLPWESAVEYKCHKSNSYDQRAQGLDQSD